ncbi:hypothetical protein CRYUN_Cryun40dG0023200 [Craigia yunnanensis]
MRMFFPLGPTSIAIYGGISALIFCGYIVYDTDNLIKRFTYDDYILASATLFGHPELVHFHFASAEIRG